MYIPSENSKITRDYKVQIEEVFKRDPLREAGTLTYFLSSV